MHKELIAVHNGKFHADDVFAVATLQLAIVDPTLINRTRDDKEIAKANYVVDVGGVYDPDLNRFDHHQEGGAGERENGVPYASFGLVWKKFGDKLTGDPEITKRIDQRLVQPIDAGDNGFEIYEPIIEGVRPYTIYNIVEQIYSPTWQEDTNYDARFKEIVSMATFILEREIMRAHSEKAAAQYLEGAYEKADDKRIIILDNYYPLGRTIRQHPEPLFVIFPHHANDTWTVKPVPKEEGGFEARQPFPSDWGGKEDLELVEASGVKDAVFCHNSLNYIAVAKSREGAIALAQKALEA